MGYYIELLSVVRGGREEPEHIAQRLCALGGAVVEGYKTDPHYAPDPPLVVQFAGSELLFWVNMAGCSSAGMTVASARLSWATSPESLARAVLDAVRIAEGMGCRLYDPQTREDLTLADLAKTRACFEHGSESAIGLLGRLKIGSASVGSRWKRPAGSTRPNARRARPGR